MKRVHFLAVLLCTGGVVAQWQPAVAGTQTMIAGRARSPVAIDGVLEPGEWSAAIPVHVAANKPGGPPGVVPAWIAPPDNQADSSFTIRAMYDRSNLYVAVEVADDVLVNDSSTVWLNDDVEILIDGDRQPGDFDAAFAGHPNNEAFQFSTTVGNNQLVAPYSFTGEPPPYPLDWESRAAPSARGYVVEVRIALNSINTIDTTGGGTGFRAPHAGDQIGFNVAVGDQDVPGVGSYDPPNGYIAWDGDSANWSVFDEAAYGTLLLR